VVGGGDSIRGILGIRRSMLSGVYIHIHHVRRRLNRRRRWYFRRRHRVSTEHVLVRVLVRALLNAFGVRKILILLPFRVSSKFGRKVSLFYSRVGTPVCVLLRYKEYDTKSSSR
jgi:hypothetical protein